MNAEQPEHTTRFTVHAADLIPVVEAVPGVRGIQASVGTAKRTLNARLRRRERRSARFGIVIDAPTDTVTVELALESGIPIREIVQRTQHAVREAFAAAGPVPNVHVRVMSVQ